MKSLAVKKSAIFGLLFTSAISVSGVTSAASIDSLGYFAGGSNFSAYQGMSLDGTILTGYSTNAAGLEAFRWTSGGGMVGLGDLAGGSFHSAAYAINGDGSVIVGQSESASGYEAFVWTSGGGMVGLGDLAGGTFESRALGISGDGTTVVGWGWSAAGHEAFRWTSGGGMVGLGDLAGGLFDSQANAISYDGTTIIGTGSSASGSEAFVWTSGGGMVGLGDLPGGSFYSEAYGVSGDGSVVIGYGNVAGGIEAFRWTSGGGMVGLGYLPGGSISSDARGISHNGNYIVGVSDSSSGFKPYRWSSATGMESIEDLLTAQGVDLTNWLIYYPTDIDNTGNIITGDGEYMFESVAYIINLAGGGITTITNLLDDLIPVTFPAQQTSAMLSGSLGQSLFASTNALTGLSNTYNNPQIIQTDNIASLDNIRPAAGEDSTIEIRRLWSTYVVGSVGIGQGNDSDNHDINGVVGAMAQMNNHLAVGAGLLGNSGRSDLSLGGESSLDAIGISTITAYENPNGLCLYGTAFVADLNLEIDRHYRNGSGIDNSNAKTDGFAYGGAVRVGWEMPISTDSSVMPYGELEMTHMHYDAYTETGGGFPAEVGEQNSTQSTSRLGIELTHILNDKLNIGTRLAWAHRLNAGNNQIAVSTTGFNGVLNGSESDKNWAEAAINTTWHVSQGAYLSAELSGRSGRVQEPLAQLTIGLKVDF